MSLPIKPKILIPVLAVAALGGGAAAVASTSSPSSSSPREAYIESLAKHLGVSPGTLTAAMRSTALERVEAAVASGRLTKAEGEKIEQRIREGRGPLLGARGDGPRPGGPRSEIVHAAAAYLGVSAQTLHSDRRAGRSLAQVAQSTPGRSVGGLKAALLAAARQEIATAVAGGRLSATDAQRRSAQLDARIEAVIHRTGAPHRRSGSGPHGAAWEPGAPAA